MFNFISSVLVACLLRHLTVCLDFLMGQTLPKALLPELLQLKQMLNIGQISVHVVMTNKIHTCIITNHMESISRAFPSCFPGFSVFTGKVINRAVPHARLVSSDSERKSKCCFEFLWFVLEL